MRPTALILVAGTLSVLATVSAEAQCVGTIPVSAPYDTVNLLYPEGSLPTVVQQGLDRAMSAWNGGCGGIPNFVDTETGDTNLEVIYVDGVYPDAAACATMDSGGATDGSRSTMRLYSKILIDGTEYDCFSYAGVAEDHVAHELGHYLGLDDAPEDPACDDHIMSKVSGAAVGGQMFWDDTPSIQPGECEEADEKNVTPSESGGGGGGGGAGGEGGEVCGAGQELWRVDCGNNGTWDYTSCLYWWEDPEEWGDQMCNGTVT